jgi:hypothetical protein
MTSLSAHVRSTDGHDGLPFHPGCPICVEQRLTGTLTLGPVVPLRARAALVAGLVAVSAAGPPVAIAAEQDVTDTGTATVTQGGSQDPAASPAADPGGDTSDLVDQPDVVPTATQAPASPDGDAASPAAPAPDEDDPVTDDGAVPQAVSPAPSIATPAAAVPVEEQTPTPTPASPVDPAPVAAAAPVVSSQPALAGTPSPAPAPKRSPVRRAHPTLTTSHQQAHARLHRATSAPQPLAPAPAATQGAENIRPAVAAPTLAPAGGDGRPIASSGAVHVVQPGESLWVIAADMLDGDASPARVAREVHRLWQLNQARIGTGNPDLVVVGTRLLLR